MTRQPLKYRIGTKIQRSRRNVFLRSDFERLGGYDQVGRALRTLASDGKLLKIGYGLYAKARPNRLTGQPMLAAAGGFNMVAEEALRRLRVKSQPASAIREYQNGSTQIPVNAEVVVFKRFNRKIGTDRFQLQITKA